MKDIEKHYIKLKSIKKNTRLVDTLFPGKYRLSPYQACQHGCKYCDGRSEKYYVEGDFERDIVIRNNIPGLLEAELAKIKETGTIAINSGTSDPYQPVENGERIMRKVARILLRYNLSASIMTKSSLILRDVDLWQQIHQKSGFTLMVSLTFLDDRIRKVFEPGASSVKSRLKILKEFKKRGMYVGVLAMPFIPYLSDTVENIYNLFEKLKEIGVDFIIPGWLTLRPGEQKNIFMQLIDNRFPQLSDKYKQLYKENRQSGNPIYIYQQDLVKRVDNILNEFSIPALIPHYIYQGNFPIYDEIYILLTHLKELYSSKGIDISELELGLKGYTQWLLKEKASFNRRRNLGYKKLEQKLLFLIYTDELKSILKNNKLANFVEEVVMERKTFNYLQLRLK